MAHQIAPTKENYSFDEWWNFFCSYMEMFGQTGHIKENWKKYYDLGLTPEQAAMEDCYQGIKDAQEMGENMRKYGTIDKPKITNA